jgi:DNA-binding beta-propeller fold protein YncE
MQGKIAIALAILAGATSTAACAQTCANHLLVSGYFSNNVAIYDACSGEFLRQLETADRIQGAQAVRLDHANDLIYVVSEGNDQIQRYRHDETWAFVDVFAQLDADFDPTGIAFGPNGEIYVASYGQSRVAELDPTSGVEIGTVLPSDSGLSGADNGMMVSASGKLYVPGYDSSTVARVDLATSVIDADFVAAGTSDLFETRGIVDEGATILVGGEGSGEIYRFNAETGAAMGTLITGLNRPTGMAIDTDGTLLVLSGNRVRRYDRTTGAMLGIVANGVDGGISGGTFVALVPNAAVDTVFANGFDPG